MRLAQVREIERVCVWEREKERERENVLSVCVYSWECSMHCLISETINFYNASLHVNIIIVTEIFMTNMPM